MMKQGKLFPQDITLLYSAINKPAGTLSAELIRIIKPELCVNEQTYNDFIQKVQQGNLTRDENSSAHFGVFIVPRDVVTGEVLIAFHKKANTWIFPGGHIEKGETPIKTLQREAKEELGLSIQDAKGPFFLSIVAINNPKRPCKKHYDIWYLVDVFKEDLGQFLSDEFTQIRWLNPEEGLRGGVITDPSTRIALQRML